MSTHILYHANCADGAAACAVALMAHPNARTRPVQYGQFAPNFTKDDDVIIVDFSYKRSEMLYLRSQVKSLLVIDHHTTAECELEGLDYCIFDMEESGATLAWKHFFPSIEPPKLLQYIKDRDLWQWALPDSRDFSAGWKLDVWNSPHAITALLRSAEGSTIAISDAIRLGAPIVEYQDTCIASYVKNARLAEIAGYSVPVLNCTHTDLISETCGALAKGQPFAATYFDTDTQRIYNLRSAKDESQALDVGEIAASLGGGGHKHAAGFSELLPNPVENRT